jgi:ribosomal protein S18 acetylase RimI-like enzyme
MLGRKEIGEFQLEIKFEKNENGVYKIENDNFNVSIYGFEIEDDFRGRGLGKSSFKKIIEYIHKNYKNNKGIYLSVFSNNDSAIKIYKEIGFKVIKKDGEVLKMKYEN